MVYDHVWLLAQVEGEEFDEEEEGYVLVNFMEKKGYNAFIWGHKDQLRVSSRGKYFGSGITMSSNYTLYWIKQS